MKVYIILVALSLVIVAGCAQTSPPEDSEPVQVPDQETEEGVDEQKKTYDFVINKTTISSIDWEVNERVTIYPVIRNLGDSVEGLEIEILANEEVIKTYSLDFQKGETKQITYDWYPEKAGKYLIRVVLDPEREFPDIHRKNNQINMTIQINEQ